MMNGEAENGFFHPILRRTPSRGQNGSGRK